MSDHSTPTSTTPGDVFPVTHWTAVLAAGKQPSPQADAALEELCRTYWYPIYAYVRRQGVGKEDAEDLTQAFFARFLQRNYFERLSSEKGKFRAFLLASLKHFISDQQDKRGRLKRGGKAIHLSLDWESGDRRFRLDPAGPFNPDQAFDREWALSLLDRVLERLRQECQTEEKGALFERLKPFLMLNKGSIPYPDAAAALGMSEGAVRVAVHRLRRRYRELLRQEISQTVHEPDQVLEEMQALFSALTK